jgi:Zinc carboxypeptidase
MKLVFLLLLLPSLLFAQQSIDQEYTQKIKEFTTSPDMITDLVDHLPSSSTVPSPLKFLGYISGAENKLTYAEDVYRYMRALEAASPRVKVFSIGKSEEGREMILVAIADEKTIQDLDRYREITKKLSDPRKITDSEADQLIQSGKPFYYATGAMHSPETGSPEMLMELAYRLAVEDTPLVQNIRNNVITLITPVLDVDGRNRMVDTIRWYQAHPEVGVPPLIYWGHYVAHDNNRDEIGLSLKLSQNISKAYFDYHPQVVHDLHESVPFLYISTGTGPYNPALDPLAINEWFRIAYYEVQTLTQKGLPGVWTYGFYDGWAPNYMFWVAHGHNSIGRFYETFGNSVPSTVDRVVRSESQRAWYRANPALPKSKWSLRNNVNFMQSGLLLALNYVGENHEHYLRTFYTLGKRAISKATTEGPAAYVFDVNQKRKGQLRDLLMLLQTHGIEVHKADSAFSIKANWPPKKTEDSSEKKDTDKKDADKKDDKKEKKEDEPLKFAAGSYIIRMDQPYSRFADTLLDTQFVKGEERIYDDTGWTLGYEKNVDVKRIANQDILKVPMKLWQPGSNNALSLKTKAIAIRNYADTDLIRLRYELKDTKFLVLQDEWKRSSGNLPAGTVVVALDDSNRSQIEKTLAQYGSFTIDSVDSVPSGLREMQLPRIAILHTWLNTQDEGWYRIAFDSLKVPYDYISTQDVAKDGSLRSKYDVIVFPPVSFSPQDIVNGLPPGPAIPWKKSELTPNLGVDETDDIRPGLGFVGIENLKKFVEDGGLLITVQETAEWAVNYGLARWVKVVDTSKLKARGSILRAKVTDASSPVVYGYDDTIPVHFTDGPVFKVGIEIRRRDSEEARPSGRGAKDDPDIPQGRPFVEMPEKPKLGPGEKGFVPSEDLLFRFQPFIPRIEDRPRVILSFPKETDQILLSGMLEGADEISEAPVVIDSPLGKGHVLLFANNPMWRSITQGTYPLIFNAIFNYQNLNAGWPPVKKAEEQKSGGAEEKK